VPPYGSASPTTPQHLRVATLMAERNKQMRENKTNRHNTTNRWSTSFSSFRSIIGVSTRQGRRAGWASACSVSQQGNRLLSCLSPYTTTWVAGISAGERKDGIRDASRTRTVDVLALLHRPFDRAQYRRREASHEPLWVTARVGLPFAAHDAVALDPCHVLPA
jgi:hypothetical protein